MRWLLVPRPTSLDPRRVVPYIRYVGPRALALQLVNGPLYLLLRLMRILRRSIHLPYHAARLLPDRLVNLPAVAAVVSRLPTPRSVRRNVDPRLGVLGLFRRLDERGVRYVVLRWFEDLPSWPPGEDVDILVHDDDLDTIEDLFVTAPRRLPCDVYAVSAVPGADWNDLPYYAAPLGRRILEGRVLHRDVCYVPEPRTHFLSLAYHAVYHKGEASGLPRCGGIDRVAPNGHDYRVVLERLAATVGVQVDEWSLAGVHEMLQRHGWAPPADSLSKLSAHSPWLRTLLPDLLPGGEPPDGELLAFVIREVAVRRGQVDRIMAWLEDRGLDVLAVKELDALERQRVSDQVRGGHWGAGPFPVSGGPPAVVVAAYDYHPTPVPAEKRTTHPQVRNGNVFVKDSIRDELNATTLCTRWTNPIHGSDNEHEAWAYVRAAWPERLTELKREVDHRRRAYRTPYRVIRALGTWRRRGKVEVIDFHGAPAVCKVFKAGRERFFEREIFVTRDLSADCQHVPPLLEAGDNYLVLPLYENVLARATPREQRRVLRGLAREIVGIAEFFFEQGYALIDFHPSNLIVTPTHELKVVDFEFLYRYPRRPPHFGLSYDVVGVPAGFSGDLPRGAGPRGATFDRTWSEWLGATFDELDPS
jgi:hypothetical protein